MFAKENLLTQLIPIVVETLGEAYPEMSAKQQAVVDLIRHEQEVYKNLRESSSKAFAEVLTEFPNLDDIDLMECPGFVPAYREFQVQRSKFNNNTIPGDFLYKLTDTYGLTEESFLKLAELENMNCDLERYRAEVSLAKMKAKNFQRDEGASLCDLVTEQRVAEAQAKMTKRLTATDNSHKYSYSFDKESGSYEVPALRSRVMGLLLNDAEVSRTQGSRLQDPTTDTISLVTAASNFYYESGGQQSDSGKILVKNAHQPDQPHLLDVISVKNLNDCVVHVCRLSSPVDAFELAIGDDVELVVDATQRQLNTCHHTGWFAQQLVAIIINSSMFVATHLLNAAIRTLFNKVTYQVSSSVTSDQCKLEVGLLGKRIKKSDVQLIEDLIKSVSPSFCKRFSNL